jgi:hypothetical protein
MVQELVSRSGIDKLQLERAHIFFKKKKAKNQPMVAIDNKRSF